jgi:DNA-binding NtrC family response regulator
MKAKEVPDKMAQEIVLLVDDEKQVTKFLHDIITREKLKSIVAHNGLEALRIAEAEDCAVAIVDLKMPGLSGIDTIRKLKENDPDIEIIVFTGYPSLDSSLAAIESRVFGYLPKPADRHVILGMVGRALERRRLVLENRKLLSMLRIERDQLRDQVTAAKRGIENRLESSNSLVGKSEGIRKVRHFVAQVAPTDLAVLILGESGTGKDVVARLIHENSGRKPNAFVKINCPAIPDSLLESELFGHEPGAFTGAQNSKPGRFRMASGGTVFLDEIGDLPIKLQAKLLQAIEDKCFTPLGGSETVKVDFRIIAATNAPIQDLIAEKRFRSDLFYRLDDFSIKLPPLRERKDDIPVLASHFCRRYGFQFKCPDIEIPPDSMAVLKKHDWPGNIRELESVIRRFVLEGGSGNCLELLQEDISSEAVCQKASDAVRKTEIAAILTALTETRWNRKKAAIKLGMSYSSLRRRIAKYDLTK